MGNTAKHCRLGLFQDSDFPDNLEDSKSTSGMSLAYLWKQNIRSYKLDVYKGKVLSRTVPQNPRSFLDNGLRMDGLLAPYLWDMVIEVLRPSNNTVQPNHNGIKKTCARPNPKTPTDKRRQKVDQLSDVDYVPTNTHSSRDESQLYIFEDNEAVIKMIIKGRSPTMTHVLRTPRVGLDWLFDRINSAPKIQIKFVDTKNQLADMLTKGSFSRDEWNHVLCFFNVMNFSMCSCSYLRNFLSDDPDPIGELSAMSEHDFE